VYILAVLWYNESTQTIEVNMSTLLISLLIGAGIAGVIYYKIRAAKKAEEDQQRRFIQAKTDILIAKREVSEARRRQSSRPSDSSISRSSSTRPTSSSSTPASPTPMYVDPFATQLDGAYTSPKHTDVAPPASAFKGHGGNFDGGGSSGDWHRSEPSTPTESGSSSSSDSSSSSSSDSGGGGGSSD
jgi:uncharacterized membrane protein YgcG